MKIGWLLLCEGIAQDGEGAFSLIRVNRNLIFADSLPLQVKRSVLVHLEADRGEDVSALNPITIGHSIKGPDGNVVVANSGHGTLINSPFPELPSSVDVSLDLLLQAYIKGEYSLDLSIRFGDGSEDASTLSFFVLDPPAL